MAIFVLTPDTLKAFTPIRFTGWDGSLELGGEWGEQTSESAGAELSLRRFRREERLRLGLQGFSVDPQLMRFTLRGGFGFSQEELAQDGRSLDANGTLLEYDLSARWLERKLVGLTAFAHRNQQVVSREFSPRTEVRSEGHGATLRLDLPPIPSSLSYRHNEISQEAAFAGSLLRWNRTIENVFYQGRRSWERVDLDLQYRFEDVDDLIRPSFSSRFHQAALFHRFFLGPDYQHDLVTAARYFHREGPAEFASSNLYASEQATLRPTDRLTAAFGFIVNRGEFIDRDLKLDEATTFYTSFASLIHQLYESLTSRLTGDLVVTDFPVGREVRYRLRPSFSYRKRIPGEGFVLLGLNSNYEQVDRDAIGRTTVEEHLVPFPSLSFDLNLPVATLADLTILNPARGIILVEGLDYIVTVAADHATIEIITTDPTRVAPGDRLLVRYRFVTLFPMRFETRGAGGVIGVDFSWIALSYQHERQNQRRLSGQDAFALDDISWDAASLQLRFRSERMTFFSMNEYRRYDSRRLTYRLWRLSQLVSYRLSSLLTANFQAAESWTDYQIPARKADRFDARLHLTWQPAKGLDLSPFAAYRRLKDTAAPDESVCTLGLSGRLVWAKLELLGFSQYEGRRRDGSNVHDYQASLRLIRRF